MHNSRASRRPGPGWMHHDLACSHISAPGCVSGEGAGIVNRGVGIQWIAAPYLRGGVIERWAGKGAVMIYPQMTRGSRTSPRTVGQQGIENLHPGSIEYNLKLSEGECVIITRRIAPKR